MITMKKDYPKTVVRISYLIIITALIVFVSAHKAIGGACDQLGFSFKAIGLKVELEGFDKFCDDYRELKDQVKELRRDIRSLEDKNYSLRRKISNVGLNGDNCVLSQSYSCPADYKNEGAVGLIMENDDWRKYDYETGGKYNNEWRWIHPRLCCKSD